MVWVRIDDRFDEHPKVSQVGPLGMALHVAALCYCNRNLTDGFVPGTVAKRLVDLDGVPVDGETVIGWLLDAGMWELEGAGYRIHDFHDFQPSKADVQRERDKTAERVKRHRERKRNGPGNAVSNGDVTPAPEPGPEPEDLTPPNPPRGGGRRSDGSNPRALDEQRRRREDQQRRRAFEVGTPEHEERVRREQAERERLAGM